MFDVFTAFYLFFLLGVFIASAFIIYHIGSYSINKHSSGIMMSIFISGIIILVIINILVFGSLDLSEILDITSGYGNPNQSF